MNTLFPIEPAFPQGFTYSSNFITEEEEVRLIVAIKEVELRNFSFKGFTANRKVASFGFDYSFDNGTLTEGKEFPPTFNFLIDKLSKLLSIPSSDFAELLITEYPVGSVINWHRDAPPFALIAGISLVGDCTFRLRPQDKSKQTRNAIISIPVNSRSLYIIQGEARSDWQHSIGRLKQPRYSITLRTLRR